MYLKESSLHEESEYICIHVHLVLIHGRTNILAFGTGMVKDVLKLKVVMFLLTLRPGMMI